MFKSSAANTLLTLLKRKFVLLICHQPCLKLNFFPVDIFYENIGTVLCACSLLVLLRSLSFSGAEKDIFKSLAKFTEKHLCQGFYFNKVADLRPATLIKKRLWHNCFKTIFSWNNSRRLLLLPLTLFQEHWKSL